MHVYGVLDVPEGCSLTAHIPGDDEAFAVLYTLVFVLCLLCALSSKAFCAVANGEYVQAVCLYVRKTG